MIRQCVDSCLAQTRRPDEIVVVNDASTDNTPIILKEYGDQILVVTTEVATGNKSRAQELGLRFVTGDIVMATDGDSVLHPQFLELVEKDFMNDPELSVVAGYVESMKHNLLTALREIDYTLGQDLYKRAQACANFVLVIPGCAGAFKTELFKDGTINFEHDTLTEDLDFTYKLNLKHKKIKYNTQAIVFTQDPPTLSSYANQMRRWYGGGWQNLRKHKRVFLEKPSAALILSTTYLEGLLFSCVLFIIPFINTILFFQVILFYIVSNFLVGSYAAFRKKRVGLLLASPFMLIFNFLNSYIFLEQFVKEIILNKKNMVWFHPERSDMIAPVPERVPISQEENSEVSSPIAYHVTKNEI